MNNFLTDIFTGLGQGVGQQVAPALPTADDAKSYYLQAIVAFWLIGGITIYAVLQLNKR